MAPIQHFAPPAGIKAPPLSFADPCRRSAVRLGHSRLRRQRRAGRRFRGAVRLRRRHIKRILVEAGATFRDLVKVNVLLTRASDVATMNKLYAEAFGPAPYPARTTCVVAALPIRRC